MAGQPQPECPEGLEALCKTCKLSMAMKTNRPPKKILQSISFFVQTSNGRLKYGTVQLLRKVATYQLSRLQNRTADRDTALR